MNQVFTKKKLAAALTLAFATGGAAVLAVAPVPGLVAAAQANQFADTTQAVGVTAGVNVPALANVVVTGQTFTITENTGGAIGPAGTGTAGGSLIIAPSGGAKFKAGTKITTSNSGWAFQTSAGTAVNNNSTVTLGSTDINSDGSVTLFTQTQSNPGAGGSLSLSTINLDTSAVSVGTSVALSLASSSTATGITKGVSTTIANVATYGVTVARANATVSKKAPGLVNYIDQIDITESILGSLYAASSDGATITVELQGGYTWTSKPALGTVSGDNKLDGASVNTAGSYTGTSSTKAVYRIEDTSDSAAVTKLSLTGNGTNTGGIFIPAGAATGDVTAVVTVNRGSTVLASTTVTLFNIAAKTTTNSFVEASGASATVDYNVLFSGRNYTTGLAGGVTSTGAAGETDAIKITESLTGSLAAGGTVSLTLDRGAKWGATDGSAITGEAVSNTLDIGAEVVSANTPSVATYTVVASSAGANPGTQTLSLAKLDLTSATAGDLNVTFGGNAGGSAATVKVADIKDATSTTVGATAATVTAGSVITVPDITIAESTASAIPNTDDLLVELPAGYVIQINGVDATDGATLTNNTDVTVTATKADGSAVSTFITNIKAYDVDGTGTIRMLAVDLSAGSSSATGAYSYKISGLKAKAPTSATAGDITATVGSAPNSATPAALGTTKSASGATRASVTVGGIVANTVPSITATVSGANTSQTITGLIVAAGNDQGKQGMIYLAAEVPNAGVFLKNSAGSWVTYNATAPVAVAGPVTLGTTSVEVTKDLNVSSIIGSKIYLGYGIGTTAFGAVIPWNNMLSAGTYANVYTIK